MSLSMIRRIKHFIPIIVCTTFSELPHAKPIFQTQQSINMTNKSTTLIFDLGGVLIDTSPLKALWHLGPRLLMSYWQQTGNPKKELKRRFYTMLNTITKATNNSYGACDYEGYALPQLMANWLAGKQNAHNIRQHVNQFIMHNPKWFKSKTEQKLMLRMTQMIFTPEIFINMVRLNKESLSFIQACKKQGYRILILSNWDPESFALLQSKYPELFDLCDGIVISGHVHDLKPNQSMYAQITALMPAHTCILIDDQPENISAARKHGMFAIRCTKKKKTFGYRPNFTAIQRKLTLWQRAQKNSISPSESSSFA